MNSQVCNSIDLNNTALDSLQAGDYKSAIKNFSLALQRSKSTLDTESSIVRQPAHFSLEACLYFGSKIVRLDDMVRGQVPQKKPYIYCSPIRIPPCPSGQETNLAHVSTAVIFNLALTYQLVARQHPESSQPLLQKAARLYELAHNLYRDQQIESVTFLMATVNNLGSIFQELDDTITAQDCFRRLFQTIMFLVDCGDTKPSHIEGFLRNTAFLYCKQNSAPAA